MIEGGRVEAEKSLARSLSRHIGYTSGAYHIDRIFSVLDFFKETPSGYREELTAFLTTQAEYDDGKHLTEDYLGDVLSFTSALELIEIVSARDAKLTRFAPTELGRAALGAKAAGDRQFYNFYIAQIVLRADADYIVPILNFLAGLHPEGLHHYFLEFQMDLRARRLEWLKCTFPERVLFERISERISWLKRKPKSQTEFVIEKPSVHTVRHHATPRQGWLAQMNMIDAETKVLTGFGRDVLKALVPEAGYFWVSPSGDALKALAVQSAPLGLAEDALDFVAELGLPSTTEIELLKSGVKKIMIDGYAAAKLVHAPQASLQLPLEYIRYRVYADRRRYHWEDVLDAVFLDNRGELERYSARKGKVGFYRVVR